MVSVSCPDSVWVGLTDEALPVADALSWATVPRAGAVVTFLGVTRDHSDGRHEVTGLTYEAYEAVAIDRLRSVAEEACRRWPLERLVLMHRLGEVATTEASVLVVAAAPHRGAAFDAARFSIDTLKETVPIWKREHHSGGSDWSESQRTVRPVPASVRPTPETVGSDSTVGSDLAAPP